MDNGHGFLLIGKLEEMQELPIELVDSYSKGLSISRSTGIIFIVQATKKIKFSADVSVKDHESWTIIQIYIEYRVATIADAGHVPLNLQI